MVVTVVPMACCQYRNVVRLPFDSGCGDQSRDRRDVPETDMHFASLGRAFQADGRGFSPIEGGLEGGGSVS
jgi:hypothetical protein